MLTELVLRFATAMSSLPSPLKSATTIPRGLLSPAISLRLNATAAVGGVMGTNTTFDTPLIGIVAGFTTVTLAVPMVAMLAAGTGAVQVISTGEAAAVHVVPESGIPFQLIADAPLTKPVPFTFSVKLLPP